MRGYYSRRNVLMSGVVSAASLGAAELLTPASAAETLPGVPIIDPHQHLWDLRRFRVPWLSGAPKLNRSHVLTDYRKAADGLNIVKTLYMEVDVDPKQQAQEAEYVIALSRKPETRMAGAVISGRPAAPDFEAYITRFSSDPAIKGVRQILHPPDRPRGFALRPEFIRGVQLLGELGMCFDVCIRPEELSDAARLAEKCPKTAFVLDHCGNADLGWAADAPARKQWKAGVTEVSKRPNVVCKISGIIRAAKPGSSKAKQLEPYVNHCLEAFGPERVMFASDWPVCNMGASLREWVTSLAWIVRSESAEDQRKLFHDNAQRFYRL